jgi:hypothetical protein
MKNTIKALAIIALVAVIGFSMTTCDLFEKEDEEETISLQGKWDFGGNYYEFTDENFKAEFIGQTARGTFTYTATHITFNPTHYGSEVWNPSSNYATMFYNRGIHGNPVPYRFERNKSGVYLYLDVNLGGSTGYKKQ